MARQKWNLNTIYISERLKACLRPVTCCALTTAVAPMGYGKTTAINWFLDEQGKIDALCLIRISVYSDNLAIFWKSVQVAFKRAGFGFLEDYACPEDVAGAGLLIEDMCHELSKTGSCYIFIDDFHLLTDSRASAFLCMLARRLSGNVHLIVAGRNQFLSSADILCLGGKVYQIGVEQLRLNRKELAVYVKRCGIKLSEKQTETLFYSSEGWFSAVYLNLQIFLERGVLPDGASDIYAAFTRAMIEPLSAKQREFLAVMGIADEFSAEMAVFVTEDEKVRAMLNILTEQNAFVKCLADGVTFRFHHMMKECANRVFAALDEEKQAFYLNRVVKNDAGILLASLNAQEVMNVLAECPVSILKAHPLAILVLMRSMFNWRLIPKMMELKVLLMEVVEENAALSDAERGNLLGECDLIMSFLCYNDIGAMSQLHRRASSQMSRPAIIIQNNGGWTFGSPSVLMMFYRGPGQLESELAQMDECMPHYYKITCGHGQGAEKIMRAEAAFVQGRFADAQIELERAYAQIEGNGQENMALCCDFLAWRLALAKRRTELLRHHNAAWLNIWSGISAYYYALLGESEKIPPIFGEHRLSDINMLAPGRPMMLLIENQVYLAQENYAKVIGRSDGQLSFCEGMHYRLVALHIRIQTAAAYEAMGKWQEAEQMLTQAILEAETDYLMLPFVENYRYLKKLLLRCQKQESLFVRYLIQMGEMYEMRRECLRKEAHRPEVLAVLTDKEYEMVLLINQHQTNREIAEKMFLSEGSVKQYVKQIYSKLQIEGDTRTKRKQLLQLLEENS